jgi:hypothetical protein
MGDMGTTAAVADVCSFKQTFWETLPIMTDKLFDVGKKLAFLTEFYQFKVFVRDELSSTLVFRNIDDLEHRLKPSSLIMF